MIHHLTDILAAVAGFMTFCGVGYYLLCLWSAGRFLRERQAGRSARPTPFTPPVSILKPLKGTDPEMYENFRSHCRQDYPEYEIIFGVSDANDPAVMLVERLRLEFPQKLIRLIVCDKRLGANTKVSCLAQMVLTAKYEHLVVNDSDIRVPGDYLRCLLEPMGDSGVGLVTCLYRGSTASSLGSQLEAACIAEFAAGVLVARQIENGLRFGLGSTLAFRRSDLQKIGGFEAFGDYLADDYELGRRLAEQSLRVKLSKLVVQTFLPAYTMSEFLRHQLRWMRTVRDARPRGYLGLVLTFGLPWALLALLFAQGAGWAWLLLALTAITRMAMAWLVGGGVLQGRTPALQLLILPLRDVIAVLVWIASFMGHTVTWRGDSFTLKRGKLVRTG